MCGSLSFSFLYHRFLFLVFTFFFLFSSVQREHDVKESILFMAKQSGNLDPNVRARSDIIIICNTELVSPCYFSFMVYMSKKKRGGGGGGERIMLLHVKASLHYAKMKVHLKCIT